MYKLALTFENKKLANSFFSMNNLEDNFEELGEEEGQELNVRQQDIEEQHKIKSKFSYLCRPPVDPLQFNETTPLILMQTDVDYYFAKRNIISIVFS